MKNTTRKAILVAALAAVTATAFAQRPVWTDLEASEATGPVANEETLAPNEALVRPDDAVLVPQQPPVVDSTPAVVPAPAIATEPAVAPPERTAAQAPITIEEKRLTRDERIQGDAMDRIAQLGNVSGKVGVESRDAAVTLTGYTSTAAQAQRVARAVQAVDGVRSVENLIRARVGGSA